jgi:predicted metal-dependent hydrolase
MSETIVLGDVRLALVRKQVKHVHLTVHPPTGKVTLVAPEATRTEVARAYAISRLGWIRRQQQRMAAQARETPRQYIERESHHVWGRRYLLSVREVDERPKVDISHRRLCLTVRPGSSVIKRAEVMHEWRKAELHAVVPALIAKWEVRLGVRVAGYFLQRMKTRWGSCNPVKGNIRLNTELVKKPRELLEYVVVHEMAHLIAPSHKDGFTSLLEKHWPQWRDSRAELNALPLGAEDWPDRQFKSGFALGG